MENNYNSNNINTAIGAGVGTGLGIGRGVVAGYLLSKKIKRLRNYKTPLMIASSLVSAGLLGLTGATIGNSIGYKKFIEKKDNRNINIVESLRELNNRR